MNRLRLGDHITTQKGYAFKSKWYADDGHPIVKVSDFTEDSVCSGALVKIPRDIASDHSKYALKTSDVVIQTVGSWPSNPASVVGKTVRIPNTVNGALLNQNAVKITAKKSLYQPFLYYLLRSNSFKEHIISTAQGAASQASITLDSIRDYSFYCPDYDQQRSLADALSNYDNLIENNNRRIAILEEMAQSLYREWFVKFRFPGHEQCRLVDSPLGKIPEGWEECAFGDAINFWNGKKAKKCETGHYPLYGANGVIGSTNEFRYEDAVIIGRVGAYCGAVEYNFEKFSGSDNTIISKLKSGENTTYLFLMLKNFELNKYAGDLLNHC